MAQNKSTIELQSLINEVPDGGSLSIIPPLEREGPINLHRQISIYGKGKAAIWSQTSPVVAIHAAGSSLRDIRVEYTGKDSNACAIHLLAGQIELRNVTVRGNIQGVQGESGVWRYPHQLYLGKLEPDHDIHFKIRLSTPVPCKIFSQIEGLTFEPESMSAGLHEIRIHIDGLRRDTLLFGVVVIETPGLKREIVVNGHAVPPGGPEVKMLKPGQVVWQPEDWDSLNKPASRSIPDRPGQKAAPSPEEIPNQSKGSTPAPNDLPSQKENKNEKNPVLPKSSRLRHGTPSLGSLFNPPPTPVQGPSDQMNPVTETEVPNPDPPKEVRKRKGASISPLFGTTPKDDVPPASL